MLEINEIRALPSWDERLKASALPVFIYGMGSGCEKLLNLFGSKGIACSGIIVSDDRMQNKSFHGFRLTAVSELEERGEDFSVAVAFGTDIPEVMERIERLSERHTLVIPETAVAGEDSFEKSVLLERFCDAEKVCSLLCDDRSQRVFEELLKFKISGDIRFLSGYSLPEEIYSELIRPGTDEIYADLGAYDGDTVREFLSRTAGSYSHIYAVEPARKNFARLLRSCQSLDSITLINAAVSDRDGTAFFSSGAGRQQTLSQSGTEVSVRSLDSLLDGKACTYIKYDVEGEDAPALLGSRETILKYCPKIRTGIYHRPYDILDIPLLLHSIRPDYRFFIRRRRYYPAWDTELIALPK